MINPSKELILSLIYQCMEITNKSLSNELMELVPTEVLFGQNSKLDSLGFINFVITVENSIEEQFSEYVTLVDEDSLSMEVNPFATVDSLSDYVIYKLNKLRE